MPVVPGYTVHRVPVPAGWKGAMGVCLSDSGHVGIRVGERVGVVWRGRFAAIPGEGDYRDVRLVGIAGDGTLGVTLTAVRSGALTQWLRKAVVISGGRRRTWDPGTRQSAEVFGVRPGRVALVGISTTLPTLDFTPPRLSLWTPQGKRDLGIGERGVLGGDGSVYGSYRVDARGRPNYDPFETGTGRAAFRWRDARWFRRGGDPHRMDIVDRDVFGWNPESRVRISAPVRAVRGQFRVEVRADGEFVLRGPGVSTPLGMIETEPTHEELPFVLAPGPIVYRRGDAIPFWTEGRWPERGPDGYLADVNTRGWLLVNGEDGRSVYVLKPKG